MNYERLFLLICTSKSRVGIFNISLLFQFSSATDNVSSLSTVGPSPNKGPLPSTIVRISVMLGVGIIGNSIILKVLLSKRFWGSTSAILLGVVAVLDVCHLLADFKTLVPIADATIVRKDLKDILRYFADISHWTVVLVTVERLLVAMFPLDIRLLYVCRRRRFIIALVGISLALAAIHGSMYILKWKKTGGEIPNCTIYVSMYALPFLSIVVLDCLILGANLRHRWKSGRNRAAATPFLHSVSAMVVGANVLLLVTQIPMAVYLLPGKCHKGRASDVWKGENATIDIFKVSADIVSSFGEAGKAPVYIALCARFRAGLYDVLSCK